MRHPSDGRQQNLYQRLRKGQNSTFQLGECVGSICIALYRRHHMVLQCTERSSQHGKNKDIFCNLFDALIKPVCALGYTCSSIFQRGVFTGQLRDLHLRFTVQLFLLFQFRGDFGDLCIILVDLLVNTVKLGLCGSNLLLHFGVLSAGNTGSSAAREPLFFIFFCLLSKLREFLLQSLGLLHKGTFALFFAG